MRNKRGKKEGKEMRKLLLIGSILLFIISLVILASALTGEDRAVLEQELASLEANLSYAGYFWLIDYNLTYPSVSVFRENSDEEIARFNEIFGGERFNKYQIFLTNLSENESYSTFDLRSAGDIDYDYVVDPTPSGLFNWSVPYGYNLLNDSLRLGTFEGVSATANAVGYEAIKLIDKAPNTLWDTSGVSANVNITVNLTSNYTFDTIFLFPRSGYLGRVPNNTKIYVSDDAVTWNNILNISLNGGVNLTTYQPINISFIEQTKRYIKLEFLDTFSGTGGMNFIDMSLYKSFTNLANLSTTIITATQTLAPSNINGTRDQIFMDVGYPGRWDTNAGVAGIFNVNITWDFGSAKTTSFLKWWGTGNDLQSYMVGNYSILSSDDGTTWTTIGSGTFVNGHSINVANWSMQSSRYLKMWLKDGYHASVMTANEIEIPDLSAVTNSTNNWNCSTNQLWSNSSCWSLGRVPQLYDNVVINGSGTGSINITNNTMPQGLTSFTVSGSYGNGKIYFAPLFASGTWGSYSGTQEWNVWGDINISNGTMYVYGDGYNITTESWMGLGASSGMHNITYDGRGQVWKSVSGNIIIGSAGKIDGVGLGFGSHKGPGCIEVCASQSINSGGGHGGRGSDGSQTSIQPTYGNASAPVSLGSGGYYLSSGGSAIKLESVNTISVNGIINMSGNSPVDGGAGGSIWLIANNISGIGNVKANGGNGNGGGGGGRVRFDFSSYSYTGIISTDKGTSSSYDSTAEGASARPGSFSWGSLSGVTNYTWPGNGWTLNGSIGLEAGNYTINGNLIVPNGTTLGVHPLNWTASDNGTGVYINVLGNVTIQETGLIDANGEGFYYSRGPGSGTGTTGGTHGGKGYANTDVVYGSETYPLELGSGSSHGFGGGAIRIDSTENIIVNGNITGTGTSSSIFRGGSGGSILLIANNLSGSGNVIARGRSGTQAFGGGGRIALHASTIEFTGLVDNSGGVYTGGSTALVGSGGTIFINATNSITSSGNISVVGYNGTQGTGAADNGQRITFVTGLATLSGIYNASALNLSLAGVGNGTIAVNYTNCGASIITGTFQPAATTGGSCGAGTNVWNCSTNQLWNNASCWSLGHVPGYGDDVIINGSGTGSINITNNSLAQNINSFTVAGSYGAGKIYFAPLFAAGTWGSYSGTQEWNVWGDINISNGTMYVYGDAFNSSTLTWMGFGSTGGMHNITYDGRGQVWKSVSGNINIGSAGKIDGVGLGFGAGGPGSPTDGGASYGGKAEGSQVIYGNASAPASLGSGRASVTGGSGIKLDASSGDILVNGNIIVNGGTGAYHAGGSGGSIWLIANNISGNGVVKSEGSQGSGTPANGAGGRIRFDFSSLSYNGIISNSGSGSISRPGTFSLGTLAGADNLIYPGDWTLNGTIGLVAGNWTILGNLIVPNGTTLGVHPLNDSATDNGNGVVINVVGNVTIDTTGKIDGIREGFAYNNGLGKGAGASHGGRGGGGASVYGSEQYPLSLGSGSTIYASTHGGGAIMINATENIIINGNITVDGFRFTTGSCCGSSSGGSIYLIGNELQGTGILSAKGIPSGYSATYNSGAGRIALYFQTINFTGRVDNYEETYGLLNGGSGGTVYINATNSITSSGNISVVGYNGTQGTGAADNGQRITFVTGLATLSGIYNASALNLSLAGVGNGTIAVNYTNCGASIITGTFQPPAVTGGSCGAGTNVWNCSTNQLWNNASCWSLGHVPGYGDDVIINGSGTGSINITNNSLAQNINSFTVAGSYGNGKIYFAPLFASGTWGSYSGTQEWNVWGDINISNGTMYVYGDAFNSSTLTWMGFGSTGEMHNITYDGRGQVWKSVSGNIVVGSAGKIDGVGLGFGARMGPGYLSQGGTHGGYGGGNYVATYGNASAPVSLGSGGGTFTTPNGGSGIKLDASSGNVVTNGVINMSGIASGHSGSGGSIWLVANNISGDGVIKAEGGIGTGGGNGGGGGRIRFDFSSYSYSGVVSVAGGIIGVTETARSGTFSWGSLSGVTNYTWSGTGWTLNGSVGLEAGNYTINGNLVIPNNTILGVHPLNATASDNGTGVYINVLGNVTIQETGVIDGYKEGFFTLYGPGYMGGAGGTYGGKGKLSTKSTYGNEMYPTSLGSSGSSAATFGGGAIRIDSTETILINGNITVNTNSNGHSGSGGSILLIANNISGNGVIKADGGEGGGGNYAGGGGRIALHASTIGFTGKINNIGGSSSNLNNYASGGTIYINATNSITISGNISVVGRNGTVGSVDWGQRITFVTGLATLSGIYNASAVNQSVVGVGNGTITANYSDCGSVMSGTFEPSATKNKIGASCSASYTMSISSPANNSNFNNATIGISFNASASLYSSSCLLSLNGASNATMTLNSTYTGANYTNSSIGDGSYNATIVCSDTLGDSASSSIGFLVDTGIPTITISSPLNNSYLNNQSVLFNVSSSEETAGTGSIVSNLDNSLVSWWRMDDVNSSGDVVDYHGCYDNETEIYVREEVDCGSVNCGDEGIVCERDLSKENDELTSGKLASEEIKNKEAGDKSALKIRQQIDNCVSHRNYDYSNNTYYLNLSIDEIDKINNESVDCARMARMVRQQPDTLWSFTGHPGSIPGAGAYITEDDSLIGSVIENTNSDNKNKKENQADSLMNRTPSQTGKSNNYNKYINISENKCYIEKWKYFKDLNENEEVATLNNLTGELEWQIPSERQIYEHDDFMYLIETDEGNLSVSPEHKVYSKSMPNDLSFSTSSLVLNTSASDCFLKCSSLDHIGIALESDNAKYDVSSLSGIKEFACSRKDSNEFSETNDILSLINLSNSSISPEDKELNFRILGLCSLNSSSNCFGEYNFNSFKNKIFLVMPNPVNPVNTIPASMTSSIYFNEGYDFFNLSCIDLLTFLANSSASFSVSLDLETISWNLSYPSVSSTLLANASLATSDQLITFNASIFFFNSSGIDIVKCSILNSSCVGKTQKTQQIPVFKSFGLNNASDVYSDFNSGKEIYFLNSENKPVKIKSIKKVPYSGKIYDVDVANDIVLVRRGHKESIKFFNSSVLNTLTSHCSLKCGSLDQTGILNSRASAKNETSVLCEINLSALSLKDCGASLNSINSDSREISSVNLSLVIPAFEQISSAYLDNSSIISGGENNSNENSLSSLFVKEFDLNNEKIMLVSTTNFIYSSFDIDFFNSLPSFMHSSSVNLDFSKSFSNLSSISSCRIFLRNDSLANALQLSQSNFSIFFLTSSGIDNVTVGILPPDMCDKFNYLYSVEALKVFKSLDSGSSAFWSGNSNNGSKKGNAAQTSSGKFGKGFDFDGVGDEIRANTLSFNPLNFTVSLWAKSNDVTIYATTMFINAGTTTGTGERITIWQSAVDGKVTAFNDYGLSLPATCDISDNQWTHITVTFNNATQIADMYVNGANCSRDTSIGNDAISGPATSIGFRSAYPFNGSIDEVLIFNRSLTASEIASLYNATRLQYTQTGLADGSHSYTAYTQDYGGNVNSSSSAFSVDTTYSQINFTSPTPANNSYQNTNSMFVNVSVTETNPSNITFNLFNNTGGATLVNSTTFSMAAATANTSINWSLSYDGVYFYNATIIDLSGNKNSTDTRTFTRDNTLPLIDYSSGTEADYANFSRNWIYANVSYTETNFANITFSLWNNSTEVNSTTFAIAVYNINWTGLADSSNYTYQVNITDLANNKNATSVRHITLDTTPPSITIVSPLNTTIYYSPTFDYNVSVADALRTTDTCLYSLDYAANVTMTRFNATYFNYTKAGNAHGFHNVTFSCNDTLNNWNYATMNNFEVNLVNPAIYASSVTLPSVIYSNATLIIINVSNTGPPNASNVNVSCYLENSVFDSRVINISGESYTITNCTLTTTSGDNKLFNVTLDPGNSIQESNENDNNYSSYINITQLSGVNAYDLENDTEDKFGWFGAEQETLPDANTYFFMNYTMSNSSAIITNAICNISFSGGSELGGTIFNFSYNSTALLYFYNRTFNYAGNYSWTSQCSKEKYEPLSSSSNISIRIPLYNYSSVGFNTSMATINYNENVNLTLNIPAGDIDSSKSGYNISGAWAEIKKPDNSFVNVSLIGSSSGGIFNASYNPSGMLGDYQATWKANLTNSFNTIILTQSNFSVQNTSISIATASEANTTDTINIQGRIRRTNSSGFWDIGSNLFTIKLNNVTVSSNTLNHTNFTAGSGTNVNISNIVQLNLTSEGNLTTYSDNYSTTRYTTESYNYSNIGYYAPTGVIFELDQMTSVIGNITYNFTSITKFYNASAYATTQTSPSDPGGNTSIWYSFDNANWNLLNSSTASGARIGGNISADGRKNLYIMLKSDTTGTIENPVTSLEINYSSYDYASSGSFSSGNISLSNVTYTTLKWDQSLNSGTIKVQLRESDDAITWNAWSANYTSNLDNDISSFTKQYLQYRAWLSTSNLSLTPVLYDMQILYFNASTNSTGGYNYNITIPTTNLGNLPLEISVAQNPSSGIIGSNTTTIAIWARTSLPYSASSNYTGSQTNYSVNVNFTRSDLGALINGSINISISNSTLTLSSKCSGSTCLAAWSVPGDLAFGNYSVNITGFNESGFYRNSSASYYAYLEEKNTTGALNVANKTISDFSVGTDYIFYWNASVNNTGRASMSSVHVYDYTAARSSGVKSISEITPCSNVLPQTTCNAGLMITMDGNANVGENNPHFISWRATWTDNDGTTSGGAGYISYTGMYVIIAGNSTLSITNTSINRTQEHGTSSGFLFPVNSIGSTAISTVNVSFISMNITNSSTAIPSSWINLTNAYYATISAGNSKNITINITIPGQAAPGNYSGIINASSANGGEKLAYLAVEVPVNTSWYITPSSNLSYNNSYSLNTAGEIGNFTIVNTGNINLTMNVSYSPSRTTDYSGFGDNLFAVNYAASGRTNNPTQVNVTKGQNTTFTLWQKGNIGPLSDVGVNFMIYNESASPTTRNMQESFTIVEQPPAISNVWLILDGINGSKAEVNKNLTIKFKAADDVNLNLTASKINLSWNGGSTQLNASYINDENEYTKNGVYYIGVNYTANYTPTSAGVFNVTAVVYDVSGKISNSSLYNFTSYATTTLNISGNISSVSISSVDKTNKAIFYVNYTINNTGNVYAYSPFLNFTKNESIIISNFSLSNISSGSKANQQIQINVSELTPSGSYSIIATLTYRNPDNTNSISTYTLTLNLASNKSFTYSPSLLNYSVSSGASNSSVMELNNTGNDALSNVNLSCYSGALCTSFTLSYNESNFSIARNSTRRINITLTAPAGLTGGSYSGAINISEMNISQVINISAYVPETLTWSATPTSINSTKAVNNSGTVQNVVISNTGNVNITFILNSTNMTIIQPNVSTLIVPKLENRSFMINYSTPSQNGSYFVIVSIANSSANPSEINVSVNLTATAITAALISPTTASKLTNVTAGQTINLLANATYGDEMLTSNLTWSISINSSSCSNLNSTYSNNRWNITCTAPSLTDGRTYNLTASMTHTVYGSVSTIETEAISYRDISAPVFNFSRNHIEKNQQINIAINITDNLNLSQVSAVLIYPNSSAINLSLSLSGGLYINNSMTLSEPGEYLVNLTANDTTGNINNSVEWFEVYDRYYWSTKFIDYAGSAVSSINITLARPNTTTTLLSNSTSSSGESSFFVNKRFYDIHAAVSGDEVIVRYVNFTNLTTSGIAFNIHRITSGELSETISLHKSFQGIASNSTNLSSSSINVIFNYTGLNYDSLNELEIVKCSNWNYVTRACIGSWSVVSSSINRDTKLVTGNSTGFSSYFLSEDKCGNGACEATYGETTSTCSADCKETTVSVSVSGGGGGGGGGSSGLSTGDIKRIEEIVKSFLDVGGLKIETTSIYKELFPGDTTTVRVKVRNSLNSKNSFDVSTVGDIKQFIFFETSSITLGPGESRDLLVKIVAPKFIDAGDYSGDIIVKVGEAKAEIPTTVKILFPEGKLLDVKIQPLTPTVAPGEVLRMQADLLNLGKTKKVDVQFDIQLIDVVTAETIARREEAFAVETSTSVVKNLTIPIDAKPGRYMIKATASYSNIEVDSSMQASSIAYVTLQYPLLTRKLFGVPAWAYFIIFALGGLFAAGVLYIRYLAYKRKRFKIKVEVNKLPQAGANAGFVGKIAETGIRAFVDLNKLQMHTLIAGATGGGKTIAAQDIIEAAALHNKSIIVFDPTAQWTGFLRKCDDSGMLKRYKYFDMNTNTARAFNGTIKTIHDPYELIEIEKYINKPGEITIFNISHLTPKEIDVVVASTIEQIFKSEPEESKELKTLIVYDEVHRLLPKFGGSGEGFVQLERGAREFRKWGIGLVLISQVLSDFVGEVKANIGTEIQLGTRYEGDWERINMKYGEDVLKSVVKEPVGTGMVVNAEFNLGKPYFVSFRPVLHSTKRLSNDELAKYEKYFEEIEDMEYQIEQFKKTGADVLDLELELKLARGKIKEGQFQMADMYLESLRPRFEETWKNINKKPEHIVRKKIAKEEIVKGIETAKKEREKYIKKNPSQVLSIDEEISSLKKSVEEKKKKGKKTSEIEIKINDLEARLKPFKGKINEKDSGEIKEEIELIRKEIERL